MLNNRSSLKIILHNLKLRNIAKMQNLFLHAANLLVKLKGKC